MYFSDPATPSTLAVTGAGLAFDAIGVAVLAFAGFAALTIYRQIKKQRAAREEA